MTNAGLASRVYEQITRRESDLRALGRMQGHKADRRRRDRAQDLGRLADGVFGRHLLGRKARERFAERVGQLNLLFQSPIYFNRSQRSRQKPCEMSRQQSAGVSCIKLILEDPKTAPFELGELSREAERDQLIVEADPSAHRAFPTSPSCTGTPPPAS